MLRLPEPGRLGPLPSPQMLPHLPLPLRKRTRLHLPVFRRIQVSAGTRGAAGWMGQELSCHLHPSCRSFCWQHRPTQQVRPLQQENPQCAVCLEAVEGRPTYTTLVCPSCTGAQFHRQCIQAQALSAALHHFRCPLCQDMQTFQAEMFRLGIKIPDRSAPTALPPPAPPSTSPRTALSCPGLPPTGMRPGRWKREPTMSCTSSTAPVTPACACAHSEGTILRTQGE
ncbi:G2/M phase-specific E3 ubiquitin-protein ligase-like [Lagopus muta]|uniref:G2/M phase-specific E3 ubiquitin-protein ligase-like n=1 Tax=Lagopus muta TaxID=64668 RepID=UPI00209D9F3A|nr:G2/M phase-specific E3 ubiquitin-protein ligase-like [Lagopus muta]